MATLKEQEELMETLKFTPRTYKIQMWGYGGEKVMGTVDPKVWDYCMENQVSLMDLAWDSEAAEEMGLDEDMLPFPPGSWYECDDMAHVSGVSRDAGTLQIEDENGETVFEKSLEDCNGYDDSPQLCCNDEVWVGSRSKGEIVFIGSSNEKGTFFEADLELKAPFDIEKLELHYDEVDGEEIVTGVVYDGEEIDNWGGSTDGKSSDFNMVRLTDDQGNFERYEPEDKDWGEPPIGPSPSDWESSPKFKFKQHKPAYVGWYSCNYGYGSTYSSLYWNGEAFGEFRFGQFQPVSQEGIETWQGYNWDTASWVNQPPEPPNLVCSNKKCGWVGMSEDRIEDAEYNDHCPECNGTDFDWIDYDPDTLKGRKNREKYCKEWDPALALSRIPVPEKESKLVVGGAWPFGDVSDTETESSDDQEETTLTYWTVKPYYKKSIEEVEHFNKDGQEIINRTGWRWGEWTVATNDGNPPEFEFDYVPGGDGNKDSIDMNSCYGNNIEESEMVETSDGCYNDVEFPDDMDENEKERLQELIDEGSIYDLEGNEGWMHTETEMWIWGPIEITNDSGYSRIVVANGDGNMIDFEEE